MPAWDYDFSGANEVHQSDDFEPLESVALFIPEGKSKTREKFKKKRDKARHKLDVSVSPETASDYQLHSCDSGEFSFCFARIIFVRSKPLYPCA